MVSMNTKQNMNKRNNFCCGHSFYSSFEYELEHNRENKKELICGIF